MQDDKTIQGPDPRSMVLVTPMSPPGDPAITFMLPLLGSGAGRLDVALRPRRFWCWSGSEATSWVPFRLLPPCWGDGSGSLEVRS